MLKALLAIVGLIIYGSLYPLSDWTAPTSTLFIFLLRWPESIERADLIQNILAYIPLGFMLILLLTAKKNKKPGILSTIFIAITASAMLSLLMEGIQQFLPTRTPSLSDLIFNIAGSAIGAALGLMISDGAQMTSILNRQRHRLFVPGQNALIGIACIGIWILAQTSPWVPTFDVSQLRRGGSAFYRTLLHPDTIVSWQVASYFLSFIVLGFIWSLIIRERKNSIFLFGTLFTVVLLSKIMIHTRQLSFEALAGFLFACILFPLVFKIQNVKFASVIGILCLIAGYSIVELHPGNTGVINEINWIPFSGQLQSLNGFQGIAELFWIGFTSAFFVRINVQHKNGRASILSGGLFLLLFLSIIVGTKQFVPGRFADITPIIICMAGWLFGWHEFFIDDKKCRGEGSLSPDPAADPYVDHPKK